MLYKHYQPSSKSSKMATQFIQDGHWIMTKRSYYMVHVILISPQLSMHFPIWMSHCQILMATNISTVCIPLSKHSSCLAELPIILLSPIILSWLRLITWLGGEADHTNMNTLRDWRQSDHTLISCFTDWCWRDIWAVLYKISIVKLNISKFDLHDVVWVSWW